MSLEDAFKPKKDEPFDPKDPKWTPQQLGPDRSQLAQKRGFVSTGMGQVERGILEAVKVGLRAQGRREGSTPAPTPPSVSTQQESFQGPSESVPKVRYSGGETVTPGDALVDNRDELALVEAVGPQGVSLRHPTLGPITVQSPYLLQCRLIRRG